MERHDQLLNWLSLFFKRQTEPQNVFLSNGVDDTVLNALIIYKVLLAQSWNPETQALGFAVHGTDSRSIRDCSWFIVYEQGSFLPNKCLLWFINEIHSSFIFWENSQSQYIRHCRHWINWEWMVMHYYSSHLKLLFFNFGAVMKMVLHVLRTQIFQQFPNADFYLFGVPRKMGMMNN